VGRSSITAAVVATLCVDETTSWTWRSFSPSTIWAATDSISGAERSWSVMLKYTVPTRSARRSGHPGTEANFAGSRARGKTVTGGYRRDLTAEMASATVGSLVEASDKTQNMRQSAAGIGSSQKCVCGKSVGHDRPSPGARRPHAVERQFTGSAPRRVISYVGLGPNLYRWSRLSQS
jgi:hypothetical protein